MGRTMVKVKAKNRVKVMGVKLMKFCHLLNIYGLLALEWFSIVQKP